MYLTVILLLHYFLYVVQSAPISTVDPFVELREVAERAKTLVQKILRDIPAVHTTAIKTEGLTLQSTQTTNLQLMVMSLHLPVAPVLKPPSEHFTLDVCVSRMSAGSQLFHRLLGVLSDKLEGLNDLRADVRDLLTHINKMKEAAHVDTDDSENQSLDLASRLHGNYEVQVATHLTLVQLRSFCHDLIRSLRAITTYRLRSTGAL